MINGNITKADFSDKYRCDDKLSEEEQFQSIVEKFSFVKRAVPCSDEELVESIKNETLQLS